jgi:hypothetical protein
MRRNPELLRLNGVERVCLAVTSTSILTGGARVEKCFCGKKKTVKLFSACPCCFLHLLLAYSLLFLPRLPEYSHCANADLICFAQRFSVRVALCKKRRKGKEKCIKSKGNSIWPPCLFLWWEIGFLLLLPSSRLFSYSDQISFSGATRVFINLPILRGSSSSSSRPRKISALQRVA